MDKTIKMAVSIDYKTLEGNFGKKFGKVGARPTINKSPDFSSHIIWVKMKSSKYLLSILLGVSFLLDFPVISFHQSSGTHFKSMSSVIVSLVLPLFSIFIVSSQSARLFSN